MASPIVQKQMEIEQLNDSTVEQWNEMNEINAMHERYEHIILKLK